MFEISRELERTIRAEFLRVLDSAVPPYDLHEQGLFDDEDEQWIRREVARMLYEPKLPNGGARERRTVERLKKMANRTKWEGAWRAALAAQKWAAVEGRYYACKPISKKHEDFKWLRELLKESRENSDLEKEWFAQLLLAGHPEVFSDFKLETLFLLEKPDGNNDRLIRLINVVNERTKPIPIDAAALHAPVKFREFCLSKGSYAYQGGEKELQKLHEDVNRAVAFKQVKQIVSFGWNPLAKRPGPNGLIPGIWFYDNCAITTDGKVLRPDDDDIFWHEGKGYLIGENSREGKFLQRRPQLPLAPMTDEAVGDLFVELCAQMKLNLGSYEGFMLVGAILAYAAAPEVYYSESAWPGVFVHGSAGSGKSTVCQFLMAIAGHNVQKGLNLNTAQVTAVGLLQAGEQYSEQPVWLEDFRQGETPENKVSILRSCYNRDEAAKHNPDGVQRELRTSFLVSGESTTNDAATRGRFVHVQVSEFKRSGTDEEKRARMEWFRQNKGQFSQLMKFVLLRRERFVAAFKKYLEEWKLSPELAKVSARSREVYGGSYAAWRAMNELTNAYGDGAVAEFLKAMVAHTGNAAIDVVSEANVNVFWQQMVTAFKAAQIPLSCFKLARTRMLGHPPGSPNQGPWTEYRLYIDPEAVISAMNIHLTRQHQQVKLNKSDLRDQFSKCSYWVPGRHDQRFGDIGRLGSVTKCWCINLDEHPLGYERITDEEYNAMRIDPEMTDSDRRRGPLYLIVEALLRKATDDVVSGWVKDSK